MGQAALRNKLHEFIDSSDDAKVEALYLLLSGNVSSGYDYSEGELSMLHERAEKYLTGSVKTYSVEESLQLIMQQRPQDEL
jgi:hypothetical protein